MGRDDKIFSVLLNGQYGTVFIVEFVFDQFVLKYRVSVLQIVRKYLNM